MCDSSVPSNSSGDDDDTANDTEGRDKTQHGKQQQWRRLKVGDEIDKTNDYM